MTPSVTAFFKKDLQQATNKLSKRKQKEQSKAWLKFH